MAYIAQVIITKYLGPSNVRGPRVKAKSAAGSVTLSWDHARNCEHNHARAAEALARKFHWEGIWFRSGMTTDERGYAFVVVGELATDGAAFVVEREVPDRQLEEEDQ